tara:strand:- start:2950 stop:4533 length:1584 start_codon:yes stop_codon:yes gene_type:complete
MYKKEYYRKANRKFVIDLVDKGSKVTPAALEMCLQFGLKYDETVGRNYRDLLQRNGITHNTELEIDSILEQAKSKQFDNTKKIFLITWAQQETEIHEDFLSNIEAYAKQINAQILIIAGRYKNPISLAGSKQQEKLDKDKSNWHPRIAQYLIANRQNIHKHLTILADVKIQPTAVTPLTGFNGFTSLESCIIGFPSIHLTSLPVLDGYPNKLLLTTGAVTKDNYSDSKAGKRGQFNHTLGFVIAECDGDLFHVRQVQCDEQGGFYDLDKSIENKKVKKSKIKYPAIVFGDLHLTEENKQAVDISFEIAKWSGAEKIIVHDIFSGVSISHHEAKDPVIQARREQDGSNNLEKELNYMFEWFNSRKDFDFVSIMSNHPLWLDRWISTNDWRKNINRNMYLKLATIAVSGDAKKGIVPYLLDLNTTNVLSLGYNDSYRLAGFELALHGDKGAGGSRGSVIQFKNLNTKTIVGHSHVPVRNLGCLSVGTLTNLRLSYNAGLSAWMHSNVLIYPNGKASHIHIIKGKYTTLL